MPPATPLPDARDELPDCRVLVRRDAPQNAVAFQFVDQLSLVGGAVRPNSGNALPRRHALDTIEVKGHLARSGRRIAFPKLIEYADAGLEEISQHRHIAFDALIG